jgi:selenocysteine lyase/cysteine desulfurase
MNQHHVTTQAERLTCQREAFNIPKDVCYLNAAYMGPLSNAVVEVGQQALALRACPTGITPSDFFVHAERVRERIATLVNADPESVAFISTAAYGIATVVKNITAHKGQNIVILAEQFPSNVYVWRKFIESGVELRTIARPPRPQSWSQKVAEAIDENTIVVAIETAHWTDGTLFDVPAISAVARAVGAWVVVDGTQTVGAHPFDFKQSGVDALIVHSYKSMLCNYGLGFAVFSERMQNVSPLEEGWLMRRGSEDFSRLVDYQDEYAAGMRRFDTSTRANIGLILMLDKACEQLLTWQPKRIREYTMSIARDFVQSARKAGYEIDDEESRASNIFGIRPPKGTDLNAVRERLANEKIYVSVRGSAIRIAPHVYNSEGDFERLAAALSV